VKRLYALFVLIVAILVLVNVFFYLYIYRQQLNYQKDLLLKQTQICGWEIERKVSDFQNELQRILFTKNINDFFNNDQAKFNVTKQLEVLISKYSFLVSSIQIYDSHKRVFSLSKDRNNVILSDEYQSRSQKELKDREGFEKIEREWSFILPTFTPDNKVILNVLINFDINLFAQSVFENYHIEDTQWQLLLDSDGSIRYHNHSSGIISLQNIELIKTSLFEGNEGSVLQTITLDRSKERVITSFYPVNVFREDLGVLFSIKTDKIFTSVILNIIILAAATFIILIVIILMFIAFIQKKQQEEDKLRKSEKSLRIILESLPIGIFFSSKNKIIQSVNKAGLEILKINDKSNIIGKESHGLFFQFKDIPFSVKGIGEDSNLYVYYDENDAETLLFKKEIPLDIPGEQSILEAFIDITPLENARKAEVSANNSKSEFIAKISQDIRTPLNGILSMSESLTHEKSFSESNKDKVEIIRKSAELLVSVINDLIDFSKTETGRIYVEEIPFSLENEIEIVVDSFTAMSEENKISVYTEMEESMQEEIIGDPFIIRQILTNLLSNAIRHSAGEKVLITAKTLNPQEENSIISISVQDDGKGISPGIVSNINGDISHSSHEKHQAIEGLLKSKKLVQIIRGEMKIETPSLISSGKTPGTMVSFTMEAVSNKGPEKNIDFSHIKDYSDIKVLIFQDPKKKENSLQKILKDMEVKSETTQFNETSISLIKSRFSDKNDSYSLIVIMDTPTQNGFTIARELFINDLTGSFLVLMISSNNRPGNLIKCQRMGVDYYLLYPYESSEIFDFIQTSFTHIEVPVTKPVQLKKIRQDLTILVAEDNAINQRVAQIIFKSLGFEIDIAPNGQKAVSMASEKEYDIIFMDIRMPVKTGFDAAYEIRNLGMNMPIVALTANVSELDRTKAMEVGMNDFLSKPVRVDNIKNILIKWFSQPV
jgi:signal transduction histidine kinase/DNA-binding response OmpR family regulator